MSFRRALTFIIAASVAVAPTFAVAHPATKRLALDVAIAKILAQPRWKHTSFGIDVYDPTTGRVIYAHNAEKFFKPASTTKLLTEGTALGLLGPSFRFTTPVYRTGAVTDGTLNGDVVLVASGDPNLSQRIQPNGTLAFENEDHSYDGSKDTEAVPGDPLTVIRRLAQQIAASGIKTVRGRVLVDDTLFPEAGPESGTGAYVSPIVVNDNLIDVVVTPGKNVGDPLTIAVSPKTPFATFNVTATTGARGSENTLDMQDVTDAIGNHAVTVVGSVPIGDPPTLYAYRVTDPRRFAEVALTMALQQDGVNIADTPKDRPFVRADYEAAYLSKNLVAKHISPPLSQDVRITLKVSDNLHASIMPYLLGALVAHAKRGQLRAGFGLEHTFLADAGLDLAQASQSDGLGGGGAYFTPNFMVHYLAWAQTQPWYRYLYRGLPILGVDGTLFDIQTHAPSRGKVHAKTGTWGDDNLLDGGGIITAKGLVGVTTTRSGRRVVFALYLNNMLSRHGEDGAHVAGQVLGELATAIYLYGR